MHIQIPFMDLDGNYGMRQVADHLVEMGHRRIAYVPACQIGTMVCQMLVRLIKQEVIGKTLIIIKPDLIVRQATGPARR